MEDQQRDGQAKFKRSSLSRSSNYSGFDTITDLNYYIVENAITLYGIVSGVQTAAATRFNTNISSTNANDGFIAVVVTNGAAAFIQGPGRATAREAVEALFETTSLMLGALGQRMMLNDTSDDVEVLGENGGRYRTSVSSLMPATDGQTDE